MSHPLVVHCKRHAGGSLYVGRPSKWGNRHPVGWCFVCLRHHDRADAIAEFTKDLDGDKRLTAQLPELRGKVLGCWCAPSPCHADVLAERANT